MVRKLFFICFILVSVLAVPSLAQNSRLSLKMDNSYDGSIFKISDYSGVFSNSAETMKLDELLQRNLDGFIFSLNFDTQKSSVSLLESDGVYTPFENSLGMIREVLETDSTKILTLFLDFGTDPFLLESYFAGANLSQYLYEHNTGSDWPILADMVKSGKRLVVFSLKNIEDGPQWLINLDDYAEWQVDPFLYGPQTVKELSVLPEEKKLFIFNNYTDIEERWRLESSTNNIRIPFFIEPFKETWIRNGMVPNFLIIGKWNFGVNEFVNTIREIALIRGTVTHNKELIENVYWKGLSSFTNGDFCFPLMVGEQITLTPISPGYKITPESIVIDDTSKVNPTFIATSLPISDGLELFLQFDENADNYNQKIYKGIDKSITYIKDPSRGMVASLRENSSIALPPAKELNLTNHDFTFSVWVKISKYLPDKEDYCIIGSGARGSYEYLQEVHFLIRNRIPYFGFFANDITGKTVIEAGKWYHIACRYNSANGEQAIFVNGELDSRSYNRPSYKGTDSLYIGVFGNRTNTFMNGDLDNLCIWSRALGDKEILGLSNGLISIDTFNLPKNRGVSLLYLAIIFATSILIVVFVVLVRKLKSKSGVNNNTKLSESIPLANPKANYIKLFGDFTVIDRNGNDITSKFSPRVKQLFLAILVNSGYEVSGITSTELTKMLWGKDASKNTDNVRGVTTSKLRGILEEIDKVEIIFHNDRWSAKFYEPVYCDYCDCLNMINTGKAYDKRYFDRFLRIVQEGEVFKNESFDWLDSCKGFISNSIVDVLLKHLEEDITDSDTIIKISDIILVNDPVNDTALAYKVAEMINKNNRKLARYSFDQFCTVYGEMYGIKYNKSFEQFIAGIHSMNENMDTKSTVS